MAITEPAKVSALPRSMAVLVVLPLRLAALDAAIKALGHESVVKGKRKKMSAEARARISAAQKKRWAIKR